MGDSFAFDAENKGRNEPIACCFMLRLRAVKGEPATVVEKKATLGTSVQRVLGAV